MKTLMTKIATAAISLSILSAHAGYVPPLDVKGSEVMIELNEEYTMVVGRLTDAKIGEENVEDEPQNVKFIIPGTTKVATVHGFITPDAHVLVKILKGGKEIGNFYAEVVNKI